MAVFTLAENRALLFQQGFDDEFLANLLWPRFTRLGTNGKKMDRCLEKIKENVFNAEEEWRVVPKLATIINQHLLKASNKHLL